MIRLENVDLIFVYVGSERWGERRPAAICVVCKCITTCSTTKNTTGKATRKSSKAEGHDESVTFFKRDKFATNVQHCEFLELPHKAKVHLECFLCHICGSKAAIKLKNMNPPLYNLFVEIYVHFHGLVCFQHTLGVAYFTCRSKKHFCSCNFLSNFLKTQKKTFMKE